MCGLRGRIGLVFMFVNNAYFIDSVGVDIVFFYTNFVICVYIRYMCVHVYNLCCVHICFGVHTYVLLILGVHIYKDISNIEE